MWVRGVAKPWVTHRQVTLPPCPCLSLCANHDLMEAQAQPVDTGVAENVLIQYALKCGST
jgi:hypothetical protein